jgi:hypothetical protein
VRREGRRGRVDYNLLPSMKKITNNLKNTVLDGALKKKRKD